jgi:hypothetical protein
VLARAARGPGALAGAGRGTALEAHLYVVDPLGNWMMRMPAPSEPVGIKRDLEKLMRGSSGWDQPGR